MTDVGESAASRARDVRHRWSAPLRPRNYRALARSLVTYVDPLDGLSRYALERGSFPCDLDLRTPQGVVRLHLPHAHDMRTVNEVFARRDYGSGRPRRVLDIGANIGVSAVYFLTRRPDAVVHCYEPHPGNLEVLRANLAPFADRVVIHQDAVAVDTGSAQFVAESVGRYSGLVEFTRADGAVIEVATRAIGDVLGELVADWGGIDLVKIDTEGSEPALVAAIPDSLRPAIGEVVWEDEGRVRRSGRARRGSRGDNWPDEEPASGTTL